MSRFAGQNQSPFSQRLLLDDRFRLSLITLAVFVLMAILNPGRFLTPRNFFSISYQFPELGLFALAVMFSLVTGGIDLSVVSTANLSALCAAFVLTAAASGGLGVTALAVAVLLAVSMACGSINGLLITRLGITPILATLGTMQLYAGLCFVATQGKSVVGFPPLFQKIGNGYLLGLPVPLLIFIFAALGAAALLGRTRLGLSLFLLGSSERADIGTNSSSMISPVRLIVSCAM